MEFDDRALGFAAPGKPDFWLYRGAASGGTHDAFATIRTENNVEAVCHLSE